MVVLSDSTWNAADERDHDEERALIAAAQADPRAFEVLYRRYRQSIYRYLLARLSSPDDAADVTQQVFLKALEFLPKYRDRGSPISAWLFRIARNAVIDRSRSRRRSTTWEHVAESEQPIEHITPESEALRHEAMRHFDALIAPLDEDKRDLLSLRFVAELTTPEIARILGKSDAAVRVQLSRTLKILKEHHDGQS